jgi:hypothetical protein
LAAIDQLSLQLSNVVNNSKIQEFKKHLSIELSEEIIKWVISQPSIPDIHREYGVLKLGPCIFNYSDQILLKTKEKYRKVIMVSPLDSIDKDLFSNFLSLSENEDISYLELITGSPEFSSLCIRLGGMKISESPIVFTGFSEDLLLSNLQGVHRENWLFQSAKE